MEHRLYYETNMECATSEMDVQISNLLTERSLPWLVILVHLPLANFPLALLRTVDKIASSTNIFSGKGRKANWVLDNKCECEKYYFGTAWIGKLNK